MKPKTMILMVVAVGCGLGASYMTSKLLADRNKQAPEVPLVPVLVAKVRVTPWQPIKDPEKLFEIKQFPQDVAPPKPVADFTEIKDQQLNKFIDEGKPVTQADLLTKEQREVALQIQPGQRAIAVKVNAESLVGGYVLPGARVDIAVTIRGNDASTRIFLQHMLVLAVDQTDTRNPDTRTIIGQTVTVAATPEESTRLALASAMGELRLLLRRPGESSFTHNLVTKIDDLNKPLRGSASADTEPAPTLPTVDSNFPVVKPVEEPKVEEAPKAPAPVKEKEVEPVRKPARVKVHVMRILAGAEQRKVRFRLNEKDEEDEEDAPAEEKPAKRDEPAKDEKKDAKPAPTKPAPTPEATSTFPRSARVPGTRTRGN